MVCLCQGQPESPYLPGWQQTLPGKEEKNGLIGPWPPGESVMFLSSPARLREQEFCQRNQAEAMMVLATGRTILPDRIHENTLKEDEAGLRF